MATRSLLVVALLCAAAVSAEIYFHEPFDTKDGWVQSEKKSDLGEFVLSSGDFYGDAKINQGLKTSQDAHFYDISKALPKPVSNKDKDFVVSLSVKHEQGLDCGGGYIKLMSELDQKQFDGDSEYWLMFGPDQCGYTKKVHIIFNYHGKNLLWKKEPRFPEDKLTHVYTLVVKPSNKYELYIDQELKESGQLEDDWAFLDPKEIDDPSDHKPADWVDEAQINDPSDAKPADWDHEPAKIADPEAKKPEDWDDEEDGAWEAPQIPNPKYKGEWKPKRIANPAYKGEWKPKRIPNPSYKPDASLYLIPKPLKYVGIDIWQVKSGSIFDNIILGDSLHDVDAIVDKTWKATKDAEKKAFDKKEATSKPPASDDAAKKHDDDEDKEEL